MQKTKIIIIIHYHPHVSKLFKFLSSIKHTGRYTEECWEVAEECWEVGYGPLIVSSVSSGTWCVHHNKLSLYRTLII